MSWIQSQHLSESAVLKQRRFLSNNIDVPLVIDDFLNTSIVESLQEFLRDGAIFGKRYKLKSSGYDIGKSKFLAASTEDKLLCLDQVSGVKEEYKSSHGSFIYHGLKMAIPRSVFKEYFENIGNIQINSTSMINAKQLKNDDFFAWHNDYSPGRSLCCVLYLSPDWSCEHGSALAFDQPESNEKLVIDALCNRLVVFRPLSHIRHGITERSPAFRNLPRWNLSWWYFS